MHNNVVRYMTLKEVLIIGFLNFSFRSFRVVMALYRWLFLNSCTKFVVYCSDILTRTTCCIFGPLVTSLRRSVGI